MSSLNDFAGKEGFTTSTLYETETLSTGAKSESGLSFIFGMRAGTAIVGTLMG